MPDVALDWLDTLSISGVTGVPGVPPQISASFAGTPTLMSRVQRCSADQVGTPGTPKDIDGVPIKQLKINDEHREHREHAISNGGARETLIRWRAGLARLDRYRTRGGIDRSRWEQLHDDAVVLFNGWAKAAALIGWTELDLFGVDPQRVAGGDHEPSHGLAWRLRGGEVIRIIDSRAQMRWPMGTYATFPRGGTDRCIPIWQLREDRRSTRGGD